VDGSHPPFRNVRGGMRKSFNFYLDFSFWSGPQFTSNLWLQLCEMLNISHKQTTADHPESNGAVERLHRRFKDTLCSCAAAATWSEELSFVLLGLRAQPREYSGLSLAEAVFGAQIVLPNEFLQNNELSVHTIVKNFSKILHVSAPSLPRHNSNTDLPSELPAELLSAPPHLGPSGRPGSTP
jgi:transposase InsO family protein